MSIQALKDQRQQDKTLIANWQNLSESGLDPKTVEALFWTLQNQLNALKTNITLRQQLHGDQSVELLMKKDLHKALTKVADRLRAICTLYRSVDTVD